MEKGKGSRECLPARGRMLAIFSSPFSLFLLCVCLWGCASPGEPVERKPPVPTPIKDLAAEQAGNTVVLTFTLPRETADRRPLKQPPDIEIYRSFSGANAGASLKSRSAPPGLLVTIPSAMVSHYTEQGHIRYVDELTPEVFRQDANESAIYIVRTRASMKKSSPDSNSVSVRVYPAAEPIEDLKAAVAHSAVTLTWTAPQTSPIGPAPAVKEYRIYRAEVPTPRTSSEPPSRGQQQAPASPTPTWKPTPRKIAETQSTTYQDARAEWGKTYVYSVRSVAEYSGEEVASSDSNLATITVRNIVPPSAPHGLVVVFVPAEGETPAHLDLSWGINSETDVAGYNVYRSEQQGTGGTRLNSELLPTPAFRDMSTVVGHRYFYSVTAVDRSGNESAPSARVSGDVPAEGQPKP
jgi:hypothetical protein